MKPAPQPNDEKARLAALQRLGILDSAPEERFDRITQEAVRYFEVPISTISIIDENREWFKSCQGVSAMQGDRSVSFCGHALFAQSVFIVEDTLQDERFKDNPMVVGSPFIRFYAGVALYDNLTHEPVGVLCIKDTKPRTLSTQDVAKLLELAAEAQEEINTLDFNDE